MTTPQTPFGKAIRQARGRTSVRAAADRAGISEGRWRQLELGYQQAGGHKIPAQPKRETARAMADAVGMDADEAERLAGFEPEPPVLLVLADPPDGQAPVPDIFAAIDADPNLLPEVKAHLRNQVSLLLRIQAAEPVEKQGPHPADVAAAKAKLAEAPKKSPRKSNGTRRP